MVETDMLAEPSSESKTSIVLETATMDTRICEDPLPKITSPSPTKKFSLMSYLVEKKAKVEHSLENIIQAKHKNASRICDAMRYSLLAGGKRIRPILCIAACEMFGGCDETVMPTAIALEMIHTMSLIHDDLPAMDNDVLRRGKPTNHVVFGEDLAILAGDALLTTAFQTVASLTTGIPADRILDVIYRLGVAMGPEGLAGGQAMDLECENRDDVGLEDLEWIHLHKTAALLQVSVAAGAVIAGASSEDIRLCELYAQKIGLAYQIADDILDVTSSAEELGKTPGKDHDSHKATYVRLMGLEKSKCEADRLIQEAKTALHKFGEKAAPLLAIADFIVGRRN